MPEKSKPVELVQIEEPKAEDTPVAVVEVKHAEPTSGLVCYDHNFVTFR